MNASMSLNAWQKLFREPEQNLDKLSNLSVSDIEQVKQLQSRHVARWRMLHAHEGKWTFALAFVLTHALLALLPGPVGGSILNTLMLAVFIQLVLWAVVNFVAFVIVMPVVDHASYWVAQDLTPLSKTPGLCKEALAFVEKNPACRAYRDRVLQDGRELCALDLKVMKALASQTAREQAELEHQHNCRYLHKIAAG